MHIAILSPIAWRTPPHHYGPWEQIASLLAENLVKMGVEVTLFATGNSRTEGILDAVVENGYEENPSANVKVEECLHISNCFEKAHRFDLIHNHFDFLPLTYSSFVSTPLLTTIHGFSSSSIIPVYKKYNSTTHYVSISNADRSDKLTYDTTIYHGIDIKQFTYHQNHGEYLLFLGRFHSDKGAREAIEIAKRSGRELVMAGIIQDQDYFRNCIVPFIDDKTIHYIGSINPHIRDEVLGGAFALLHPIQFNEPFGLSVVEAMACGTPTVAFKRGSLPEIVTSGVNGFLVDTIDEATEAIKNIHKIDRNQCRLTVEKRFTSERMTRDYLTLYRSIIESSQNGKIAGAW